MSGAGGGRAGSAPPAPAGRRGWLVPAAALGVWLWVTVPLALGERTFFFRDVVTTHLPLKAFGAEQLAAGRIPAFNPTWGLGQPFRGNPNALPFYPGNILYLLLPFWSAFNLHYALHWLLAAEAVVLAEPPAVPGLRPLAIEMRAGVPTALLAVERPAPPAWWPREAAAAENPAMAFREVSRSPDPVARVTVPEPLAHGPDGSVRLLAAAPDRLVLEVASATGGVVALGRAFHPLFRARSEDGLLPVLPVDLALLGVEVPGGRHRVTIAVEAWPEAVAGGAAAVAALVLAGVAGWPRRGRA